MLKRINPIRKYTSNWSSVSKNTAKLVFGSGMGKAIGVFFSPLLTRVYLPEDFALFSVFMSIVALIAPIGTLLYQLAIPLPNNHGGAANVSAVALMSSFTLFALLFPILYFFGDPLLNLFNVKHLNLYWWLIPLAILFMNVHSIYEHWAVRLKKFKTLVSTKIIQTFSGNIGKLTLGLLSFQPAGLLIGHMFTWIGGIVTFIFSFKTTLAQYFKQISRKRIQFFFLRYIDFPKYRLASDFLMVLTLKSPILYFSFVFSEANTGQLGLALTMVAIPMALFGKSVSQAFYGEISALGKGEQNKILKITKHIMKRLFFLGIIPFLVLLFFGPYLFDFVFGNKWYTGGVYASILSFFLLIQFVFSPIADGIFNVFEGQKYVLIIVIIRLVLIALAFWISYYFNFDDKNTLILYTIANCIQYLIAIVITFRVIVKLR